MEINAQKGLEGLYQDLHLLQNKQFGLPQHLEKVDQTLEKWILETDTSDKAVSYYFNVFSFSGKEQTTMGMALLTAAFLLRRKQGGAACSVLMAVGGGWLINETLKRLIKRPRPLSLNALSKHSNSYSFPSGHSNLAVCYYGALAWLSLRILKRPPSRCGWLFLMLYVVLMIGISRVYRREHYPTDVLGGYLVGSLWLSIVMITMTIYKRKPQPPDQK